MDEKQTDQKTPIRAGIFVNVVITIDENSWNGDSLAFGACLQDLQREGWFLNKLERWPGAGGIATLSRRWMVEGPRPIGESHAMAMGEIQGEIHAASTERS